MDNVYDVRSKINQDCVLILDAVRRLREGTWLLSDEDTDWTIYLLPKISEAVNDHFKFEKSCVQPDLPHSLSYEHLIEHNRIWALLWAADQSRRAGEVGHFHSLLDLLFCAVEKHHLMFGQHLEQLSHRCEMSVASKIRKRAECSSLECA